MKRSSLLRSAALTALLLATAAGAARADVPHPTLQGIRPLGMGDAFVSVADDHHALYYNPAALSRLTRTRVSGFALRGGIDTGFFDLLDFVQQHEEEFSDFENVDPAFLDELAPYDDRWVAADAAAYADLTKPGLGFGIFTTASARLKVDRGVYEPRIHAKVQDDIVGVIGGSLPLGFEGLFVGGAVKAIWRRQLDRALTAREAVDLQAEDFTDQLAGAEPGFGMDLGAHWLGKDVGAGAVIRDAAGTIAGESVGAALDVGAHVRPLARLGVPGPDLVVALDVRDVLEDVATGQKIRIGAEVKLPVLSFRTGVHEGYPSLGASISLPVLSLDYALYGRELGTVPGAEGQYLHVLEARLGF